MGLHLVPLLVTIQRELHIAFGTGRVSATLDAALVAYGAYWKQHGRTSRDVVCLMNELLASMGHDFCAATSPRALRDQDVAGDIIEAVTRPFRREERDLRFERPVLLRA